MRIEPTYPSIFPQGQIKLLCPWKRRHADMGLECPTLQQGLSRPARHPIDSVHGGDTLPQSITGQAASLRWARWSQQEKDSIKETLTRGEKKICSVDSWIGLSLTLKRLIPKVTVSTFGNRLTLVPCATGRRQFSRVRFQIFRCSGVQYGLYSFAAS